MADTADKFIHLCPPIGQHTMPCCGLPTTKMRAGVLLTLRPERVTCPGPAETPTAGEQ